MELRLATIATEERPGGEDGVLDEAPGPREDRRHRGEEEAAVRAHEGDLAVGAKQGAELGEEGRGPAGRAGLPTPQPDARNAVHLGEHRKEGMVGLRSTSRKAPAATRSAM